MASRLENKFIDYWRLLGGPELKREYRFDAKRRWRFDFCHVPSRCAIELDGGTWSRGKSGHNTGTGIRQDAIKRNAAALAGWTVFRLTSDMLRKSEAAIHIEPIIEHVRQKEQELVT